MDEPEIPSDSVIPSIRRATILMGMTYPIVSAYEFDFLQEEKVIRERWDASTIYLIVQRPLTYFDNIIINDDYIWFDIADGDKPPLRCRLNLVAAGICREGEEVEIQIGFYAHEANNRQPIRNACGFRLYRNNGDFIVWWSPQKLLYEMLVKGLKVEVAEGGAPQSFLDFKIHYIGKSFSQKVWDRLTGHEKMQRILTREREVGQAPEARTPFEISLVILKITGVDDLPLMGVDADDPIAGSSPILHYVDDSYESIERFMSEPSVKLGDEALTREAEAYLINLFKPTYNKVLFDNYPKIRGGMRSKGYSMTEVEFEGVPVVLYTNCFSMAYEFDSEGDFI